MAFDKETDLKCFALRDFKTSMFDWDLMDLRIFVQEAHQKISFKRINFRILILILLEEVLNHHVQQHLLHFKMKMRCFY